MIGLGQIVWHVSKNVSPKEVTVRWISPLDRLGESMVLVEVGDDPLYTRYRLIPRSKLSETRPRIKCQAPFALSLTQEVGCDLLKSHRDFGSRHHAFIGSEGAEVFWG